MSRRTWLNTLFPQPPRSRHDRRRARAGLQRRSPFRGALEPLEGRLLPTGATVTVNNPTDVESASQLSLRQAIELVEGSLSYTDLTPAQAAQVSSPTLGPDTVIQFDPALDGQTITLAGSELPQITTTVTINGPTSDDLTVSGGGMSRVFDVAAGGILTVSDLTLTDGNGFADSTKTTGVSAGGDITNAGTLTLTDDMVSGGSASQGGGIANSGALTLSDTTVSGSSSDSGGGLWNAGTAEVDASTFSADTAINSSNSGSGDGGAIDNLAGANLTVNNGTFTNNSADNDGGAIESLGGLTVVYSTFSTNGTEGGSGGVLLIGGTAEVDDSTFATNSAMTGGGIAVQAAATLTVTDSTFLTNSATGGGGAIESLGALTISGSTLSQNSAGFGGGLDIEGGTAEATESTLYGNTVSFSSGSDGGTVYGGAASVAAGALTLINDTVTGNSSSSGEGGGIVNGGTLDVANSILSGNTDAGSGSPTEDDVAPASVLGVGSSAGSFDDLGHNLIGVVSTLYTTAATDVISSSPSLGPLQDNGGPTETMLPATGSPAIGNGGPTAVDGATDERGYSRIVAGATDIGAVESAGVAAFADLAVDGDASPVADDDGDLAYLLTVSNNSTTTAQPDPTLANVIPDDTTLVSWTTDASGWTLTAPAFGDTGTVAASTGSLAPGASATFTLIVRVDDDAPTNTEVDDTVSVGPIEGDPDPDNNELTLETTIQIETIDETPAMTFDIGPDTPTVDFSMMTVPLILVVESSPTPLVVTGGQMSNTFVQGPGQIANTTLIGGPAGSTNTFEVAPMDNDGIDMVSGGGTNILDITQAALPTNAPQKPGVAPAMIGATVDLTKQNGEDQLIYQPEIQNPDIGSLIDPSLVVSDSTSTLSLDGRFQDVIAGNGATLFAAPAVVNITGPLSNSEAGSQIVLTGSGNTVYAAPGSSVQSFSGGNNVVQSADPATSSAVNAYLGTVGTQSQNFLTSAPAAQQAFLQQNATAFAQYLVTNPASLQGFLGGNPTAVAQYLATNPAGVQAYLQMNTPAVAQYLATNAPAVQAYLAGNSKGVAQYLVTNPVTQQAYLSGNLPAVAQYITGSPTALQAYLTENSTAIAAFILSDPTRVTAFEATDPGYAAYLLAGGTSLQAYLLANPANLQAYLTSNPSYLTSAGDPSTVQNYLVGNPTALQAYLQQNGAGLAHYVAGNPPALQAYLSQNSPAVALYVASNPAALQAYLATNSAAISAYILANPTALSAFEAGHTGYAAYLASGGTGAQAYLLANPTALQSFLSANPSYLQAYLSGSPATLQAYLSGSPAALQAYLQQNEAGIAQYVVANPTGLQAYLQASAAAVSAYLVTNPPALAAYLAINPAAEQSYMSGGTSALQAYLQVNTSALQQFLTANPTYLQQYLGTNLPALQQYIAVNPPALQQFLSVSPTALQQYLSVNPSALQQYLVANLPAFQSYVGNTTGLVQSYLSSNPSVLQQYITGNPAALQQYLTSNPTVLQQYLTSNPTILQQYLSSNPTTLQQYLTSRPTTLQQYLTANPGALQQFITGDPGLLQQFLSANPTLLQSFLGSNGAAVQQFLSASLLNLFRVNANLPGNNNEASGGLLSSFTIGNGLFTEDVTLGQAALLSQIGTGGITLASFALNVTMDGGNDTLVGGLLGNFTALGGGSNRFVIEDQSLLGLAGDSTLPAAVTTAASTFTGSGPNDTFDFVGGSAADPIGHVILKEPAGTRGDTLDFSNFEGGGIDLDLNLNGEQTVDPGNLWLTLPPDGAVTNVVGSSASDTIIGNGPGDVLQGSAPATPDPYALPAVPPASVPVQYVLLDFTSHTPTPIPGEPGEDLRTYTAADQQAVLAGLEADYAPFPLVKIVTTTAAIPAKTPYVTVFFNDTPTVNGQPSPGGFSNEVDFGNLNQSTTVLVDVNGFLGTTPGLVPDTEADFVNLSTTVAAHEVGHTLGLEHMDAFGPVGFGISNPPGVSGYLPTFTGPLSAFTTRDDIIASPASVGSTLSDAASGLSRFGVRDAISLAYISDGTTIGTYGITQPNPQDLPRPTIPADKLAAPVTQTVNPGSGPSTVNAQPVSLYDLNVPNPITTGFDADKTSQVAAVNIDGYLGGTKPVLDGSGNPIKDKNGNPYTVSVPNYYSFTGQAGQDLNFQAMSASITSIPDKDDTVLTVFGPGGAVVASNDDQFEPSDSSIFDLTLPKTGTYVVEVSAFRTTDPTFNTPGSSNYNPAAFYDASHGEYELFIYDVSASNATTGADAIFTATPAVTLSETSPSRFTIGITNNQTPAADLTFESSLDGGPFVKVTGSSVNLPTLSPGRHTIQAEYLDIANNVIAASPVTSFTVSPAARLALVSAPTAGTAGIALSPIQVALEGPDGAKVSGVTATVTLRLTRIGLTGVVSTRTLTAKAVNGVATFRNLVLDSAGVYHLTVSAPNLSSPAPASITVRPGVARKLAFLSTPLTGNAGQALGPAPRVVVEDAYGNIVTGTTSRVTVSVAPGQGDMLSGFRTAPTTAGLATFNDLVPETYGAYTLTASDGRLAVAKSVRIEVGIGGDLYVLDASASSALSVKGQASLVAAGLVQVNSGSPWAVTASGYSEVEAGSIRVVGGVRLSGPTLLSPAPITGILPASDPLAGLPAPATVGLAYRGSVNLSGYASLTIGPGIYTRIKVGGHAHLTLLPGVYVLDGGGMTVSGLADVTGSGVLIENGAGGRLTVSGFGSVDLTPMTTGADADILFVQPADNTQPITLSGFGSLSLNGGAIDAPSATLTVGGAAWFQAPAVVARLHLSGYAGGNAPVVGGPLNVSASRRLGNV